MAKDEFPIDHPDDEIPPANPARRRVAMYTGCLFVVIVVGFLIWFAATYNTPADDRGSLFGMLILQK